MANFEKEEDRYRTEWEKNHPGQTFNIDDPEHEEWREENAPEGLDENLILSTQQTILSERRLFQQFEQKESEALRAPIERIAAEQGSTASTAILKLGGGDTFEAVRDADPALAYALRPIADATRQKVEAASKLFTPGSPIRPDPNDPIHATVLHLANEYERQILAMPEERRAFNGLPYVPWSQYSRMTPAKRQGVWTIRANPGVMEAALVNEGLAEAQAVLTDHSNWKAKRAAPAPATPTPPPTPTPAPTPAPTPEPAPARYYFRPPAGGTGGPIGQPSVPTPAEPGPRRPAKSFFHE